jgi:asparagine synthase (glutamine-hydrolysing)
LFTHKHVKVALSGDGADELFKGYNKHRALVLSESAGNRLFSRTFSSLLGAGSRQGKIKNRIRQLKKFATLTKLPDIGKQKFLASVAGNPECMALLKHSVPSFYFDSLFHVSESLQAFPLEDTFDLQTVLADDMLVKADRFSMRHGLELRNPFMDYRVVEYALNLPQRQKISRREQKIILRKTFGHLLPAKTVNRGKKGFELPLQKWLNGYLQEKLKRDFLDEEKIRADGILNPAQVKAIMQEAGSENPGDSPARLWAVIVFNSWLNQYQEFITPATH